MHSKGFFYENYKSHPEAVLKRIAGDYGKLTPEAQEALQQVLRERSMEDVLAGLAKQEIKKSSLSSLSHAEIRSMINMRLARGEKPERIKADLADRGVNLLEFSQQESEAEQAIEDRFVELQQSGKTKEQIDQQLRNEFKLSKNQSTEIPDKIKSNGAWFIVAGAVVLMISAPMLAVGLQNNLSKFELKLPLLLTVAGAVLLILGLRKRIASAKFIRQSEHIDGEN